MNVGTKSLLWGVHQFLWHPYTVLRAWKELYGWPNWKALICILIHDWGYWGSPNMDGEEGEKHPRWAARWARLHLDSEKGSPIYSDLCLLHSRHYARRANTSPSRLCWADKLSIKYDPEWFYLLRARLSGELKEYRKLAADSGHIPRFQPDHVWFLWAAARFIYMGYQQSSDGVSYQKDLNDRGTK